MVRVNGPSCCYCKLNVPEGVHTLEESCGIHTGLMDPGMYCCYCSYKSIYAMVTKNTIRFDAPIQNCPTKDNVRVTVDISINFHIGTREDDPKRLDEDIKNFIYYLGPKRLEEMLEDES